MKSRNSGIMGICSNLFVDEIPTVSYHNTRLILKKSPFVKNEVRFMKIWHNKRLRTPLLMLYHSDFMLFEYFAEITYYPNSSGGHFDKQIL